jgi:hypothetical protein
MAIKLFFGVIKLEEKMSFSGRSWNTHGVVRALKSDIWRAKFDTERLKHIRDIVEQETYSAVI